jgi:hypothetical protein
MIINKIKITKIIGGFFIFIFAIVISYISIWFIDSRKYYDEIIIIKAYYQNYACGRCWHMKVFEVDSKWAFFIIDKDIYPYSDSKIIAIDKYISKQYPFNGYFLIKGWLHRYKRNHMMLDIEPDAYKVRVKEINFITD